MDRSFVHRVPLPILAATLLWAAPSRAQDLAVPTAPAAADTLILALPEAHQRALRENPAFLAERQATAAAQGRLRQARVYPLNPELEIEAPGVASGSAAASYEASLVQEIEPPGRRRLRVGAAQVGLERTGLEVRDAARLTLAEVSEAFFTALATERRLALAEQILSLNQRLLSAIRIQRREGEISALQANLAEIEVGRARARVLSTRREAVAAELALKRVTGIAPDRPIRLADATAGAAALPLPDTDSLVSIALAQRPDLAARTAAVRESQALVSLARSEGRPNLRVGALVERDEAEGSPRFGIGIGTTLPVLNGNQGVVAERQAEAARAQYAREAVELRIRAEVAQAVQAYRAATREVAVYESDVLQPTRQNQELLETAYRAGKIDLPSLLLVRNQLREAELGYWEAWLTFRRARVHLDAVTGASISTIPADVLTPEVAR